MIAVLGAGAFGTALAVALAKGGRDVGLWARSPGQAAIVQKTRRNEARLPGVALPETVTVIAESADFVAAEALLLCVPMQALSALLDRGAEVIVLCKRADVLASI